MAIEYLTSFNSGELSDSMLGRTDIKIYKKGCKHLENGIILPQGGVERRTGTEFITKTNNNDGTASARLIPFEFSSDTVYVVEIGNGYARVFDSVGTSYSVGGTVPYLQTEIREVQYISRFDTLILTHPNHPPQQLQRTATTPTFAISRIDFIYPHFLDENATATTITPSNTLTVGGTATLTASHNLFTSTMATANKQTFIKVRHARSGATKRVTGTIAGGATDDVTASLDVSFSDWKLETDGTWTGVITLERSIDNGANYDVFAQFDTTGVASKNFVFNSPLTEGATTLIRLKYESIVSTDGMGFQLSAESIYSEGIVKVTGFTSATVVSGTVLSKIISTTATTDWSLGAFSTDNGFPRTASFFQNRLFFSGTSAEPGTIYGSVSGDFFNNLQGNFSDLAIKRVPNSPESTRFLEAKRDLFAGTTGTIISVSPASTTDEIVSSTNIKTIPENAYGSSTMQGFIAGNAVLYTQKDLKKIRELIYDSRSESFTSNDLNVLNDLILDGTDNQGVVETFLQKQPNQIFWCIKNDGNMATLLYEREQEVVGWNRITTDGTIVSGAAVSGNSEDVIWIIVNRGTALAPAYCIEKFKDRNLLNWYVDSGKQEDYSSSTYVHTNKTLTLSGSSPTQKFTFLQSDITGLNNGDLVKVTGLTALSDFNNDVYKLVTDSVNFVLKTIDGTSEIRPPSGTSNTTYTVSVKKVVNTLSGLDHLEGQKVQVVIDSSFDSEQTVSSGSITSVTYGSTITAGLKFETIIRPMPIEPTLRDRLPNSRVKGTTKVIANFRNTKGAKVGQEGKRLSTFPVLSTSDKAGEVISVETGQFPFFIGSDWQREKVLEVKQDLPHPLTLLSLSCWTQVESG
jgi:hypothetical protein